MNDAPITDQYRKQMNALAEALDSAFNGDVRGPARETGFVLLVFPYGDREGRCNYISNGANRNDIVTMFKEMIARFEGQPEITGHG